ncbi:hypothetical protein VST7929_00249 [Vibrio stylophorae]|uniref:DUF3265 domain-containing protein n=1 Tax=Vibrio stylophorae TaxID=659351 RepID=A0ABN8DRL1_9VIBR|nr:hypothetical protein VST7929_00249 [Vibrio stylophorae]
MFFGIFRFILWRYWVLRNASHEASHHVISVYADVGMG